MLPTTAVLPLCPLWSDCAMAVRGHISDDVMHEGRHALLQLSTSPALRLPLSLTTCLSLFLTCVSLSISSSDPIRMFHDKTVYYLNCVSANNDCAPLLRPNILLMNLNLISSTLI